MTGYPFVSLFPLSAPPVVELTAFPAIPKCPSSSQILSGGAKSNRDDFARVVLPGACKVHGKLADGSRASLGSLAGITVDRVDKLERWAPLPHHPRLRLRVKPDAVPTLVHAVLQHK